MRRYAGVGSAALLAAAQPGPIVTDWPTVRSEPPRDEGGRPLSVESILGEREAPRGVDGEEVAAATRPIGASTYKPWWKVWLPIPLLIVLLDVSLPVTFWQIPKLSGMADDFNYQFLYDLHHLNSNLPAGVRVVAFGSSVASAFDPFQVSGLLQQSFPDAGIEVRRLLQPGMKPSDYRVLWSAELERVDPAVLVAVFNLVDFLNPSFERALKPGIRYVLPPWETLRTRYEYIPGWTEKLEMVAASVSNLYRYRKLIRSSIRDHAKLVRSWWRAGTATQPYGIFADGYTEPRFGVPVGEEIEVWIDPGWIEQRGRARISFEYDGRIVARIEAEEPGWTTAAISLPADAVGVVHGTVEGGWSRRAAGSEADFRLLGVRLKNPPVLGEAKRSKPPLRYPPVAQSDIKPFLRMGSLRGREYAERWFGMLRADSDFAKRYRLYREAKSERVQQPFEASEEFAELAMMLRGFAAGGRRVVMVNTPESPLLEGVVDSQFYADYLSFFEGLANSDPRITFVDLHDEVPAEDLNDWHHLNFVGQIRVGTLLARRLDPVVADILREGAEGP